MQWFFKAFNLAIRFHKDLKVWEHKNVNSFNSVSELNFNSWIISVLFNKLIKITDLGIKMFMKIMFFFTIYSMIYCIVLYIKMVNNVHLMQNVESMP